MAGGRILFPVAVAITRNISNPGHIHIRDVMTKRLTHIKQAVTKRLQALLVQITGTQDIQHSLPLSIRPLAIKRKCPTCSPRLEVRHCFGPQECLRWGPRERR